MKLWQKNYQLNKQVEDFTVADDYIIDQKLVSYDCLSSIAHAKMLGKIGILDKSEVEKIGIILSEIIKLSKKGKSEIRREDEDCHTAIENYLTEKLGSTGKKIHTARSRNDQVLTALRLYSLDQLSSLQKSIDQFVKQIKKFISNYGHIELPGYTHTRKAMPTTIGIWASSFIESAKDNQFLLSSIKKLINQSPLGTGAGYGIPLELDRAYTAKLLNFRKVQLNPIYAQMSRLKFESSILHLLTQISYDLNKLSSDLILFSMPEFGYFDLSDEICTGSSIMPHKKNPDLLELLRANYHTLLSNEMEIKSIKSNLISGYHRDFQLSKKTLINSFEISINCLAIATLVFSYLKVNKTNCKKAFDKETLATHKLYDQVKNGVPFRDAYNNISKMF